MTLGAGYSLVELLVATGITLAVMGTTLPILNGVQEGFAAQGERADLQQRVRVATEALARGIGMAGGGASQGGSAGPLGSFVASVFPFRQGALDPDAPGIFRSDALTVVFVEPGTAAQTTIGQPMAGSSGTAVLNLDAGCPPGDAACGFAAGMDAMVYDDTGSYDMFRVTSAQGGALQLQHTMIDTPQIYLPGAKIAQAAAHTYSLKADPATDTYQLMHYDGVSSNAAVVDHIVGLRFEYFGDPAPPVLLKPVTDPVGPWTTYGPKPPPLGTATTGYAPGENCAFQVDASGLQQTSRLATLGAGTALVALTGGQLEDGPWCPDALNPHRYDADLLRIRKIGITMRVEASSSAVRGPAGALFFRGGSSRASTRWVPDQEVHFEITPSNLGPWR